MIIIGYAIPGFLFAIFLIVIFAGGSYFDIFPLRGPVSDNWEELSIPNKIIDYFWHLALPVLAMVIGGFASLTMLTKNSFLDEINNHVRVHHVRVHQFLGEINNQKRVVKEKEGLRACLRTKQIKKK